MVPYFITFSVVHQPLVGQGLLIVKSSQSNSETPHSFELLWTSDQPDADIYLTRHSTHNREAPTGTSFHEDFIFLLKIFYLLIDLFLF